jgi:hypothetical protein
MTSRRDAVPTPFIAAVVRPTIDPAADHGRARTA